MSRFEPEKKLGKRDAALAIAIARGASAAEAAKAAGVSVSTVARRKREAWFQQLVIQTRNEAFEAARGQLAELASEAIGALRDLLKAKRPAVRLRAAQTILRFGRVRESELELRMTAVEEAGRQSL